MRKIGLVVITFAVLAWSAAAIVLAAPSRPDGKGVLSGSAVSNVKAHSADEDEDPMAVVKEHLDALNHCDVNRLMAQYPESVHLFLPGGSAPNTVIGRAAVRALFEGFCKPFAQGGLNGIQFSSQVVQEVGDTVNVQWVANADFLAEPYYGADAYVTKDGLMYAQVTTFGAPPLKFKP